MTNMPLAISEMADNGIVLAGGSTLTAAVAYLFKLVLSLTARLTEISEKLGEYRGRQEGSDALAARVLTEMKDHKCS